jgi:hypothetical protein
VNGAAKRSQRAAGDAASATCTMRHRRPLPVTISLGLAAVVFSCRGYDTIPAQEADWKRMQPQLAGMSSAELWRCAGPPLREETSPSGVSEIIYRYADLQNFCQVTLVLERGKVRDFSADHSAPEFFWLVDGSNYCGRIFQGCIR